jgi:hypothetical protein
MTETNATYNAIAKFYKSSWNSLSVFELGMICSNISMAIASGRSIELSHFDGTMRREKKLPITDRIDAAQALQAVSALLIERLKAMPQAEIEALDRQQKMMNSAP